ncbi:preprotein translocase subunit SecG [Candidatus Parcubacteria bacterium]|nr:MAG: preprotein translocase subunit SecG [Candidatus Parcubacteria bacterium]
MSNILDIIQLILAILLTAAVLIQNQGAGLGGVFGGEGGVYRTKRGAEKKLYITTIVLAILFFGVALANVLF